MPGVGALSAAPRLHFIDNLDPVSFDAMLARLPLATARFVAISKSGGTAETLMQTIAALSALKQAGHDPRIAVLGVSEPAKPGKRNGLRDLLGRHQVPMLDHDPGIGGRFSALSNVGLLPAAMLGLDLAALRQGAAAALAPLLAKKQPAEVPAALGAALAVALAPAKPISVLMAYCDRLERFTRWYVQLWAESLGKDGKGTTPLGALGPVDQHSQVQLYHRRPARQIVHGGHGRHRRPRAAHGRRTRPARRRTGLCRQDHRRSRGRRRPRHRRDAGQQWLPGAHDSSGQARRESLGELLMHFMLETIIAAHLIGIDAFDQPAVEEGKVLAKKYLTA